MFHHAKGGLPIFKEWIVEQKQQLKQLGGEVEVNDDIKKMEEELQCAKCKSAISNFFTSSNEHYWCLKCGMPPKKGPVIQVYYRLFYIATTERIVDKINSKINGGTTSAAAITNLINTDDVEIIGKPEGCTGR